MDGTNEDDPAHRRAKDDAVSLAALDARTRGAVVVPSDEEYDRARAVWNGLIDRYPAAIVQCTGVADVIESVDFARRHDLLLAVRSGGHDYAGNAVCDDGLVVDLSGMDGIRVDPRTKTIRAGPGVTWEEFYHETGVFDLATPGGINGVGIAGFTLGGGIGYLSRKHGFTVDNLRGVDIVTADGRLVHATADDNPDLFWAVRGGGGNFGIVTSFEFDLHDLEQDLLIGTAIYPHEALHDALSAFRRFAPGAPDELMCYASITELPDGQPFPAAHRGEPALTFTSVYAGDHAEGREHLAAFERFAEPLLTNVRTETMTELAHADESGIFYADRLDSKSQYLASLPDGAIETIARHTAELPGIHTMVAIGLMGGAINRVDASAMALPHRDAMFEFDIWPAWSDPDRDEELLGWARDFHDDMAQYASDGVYVNLLGHGDDHRVDAAYLGNMRRLREIKRRWDPDNLFRMNHNIEPADG